MISNAPTSAKPMLWAGAAAWRIEMAGGTMFGQRLMARPL